MLIHGAWLSARSWEQFAAYFEQRGFDVSAPEWPRKHGDVDELRELLIDAWRMVVPQKVAAAYDDG